MRKACFIIFFLLLSVVTVFSQPAESKITIRRSNISVEKLLKEITSQSGIHFSYNPRSVDTDQQISFQIKKASLEETLELLASKIPIEYSIIENQIVLNRLDHWDAPEVEKLEYFTISGFINDRSSGESLIGATAYAKGTSYGTTTNDFGYYSLRLPKGNYDLEYSYLGFSAELAKVELDNNENKDVGLANAPFELPDVIVELPLKELLGKKFIGELELHPNELEKMPEFGGESGLIRGMQAFPGIKTHSDGSAFFFVRGGARDQNMVIIDDAPIYNPAHLFGFYSLVVPDFTKNIKLYKNDIPVNLGDRLSSIVDVRTRDGNLNKLEFSGAYNPLIYRLSLEGPIVKEKSSFFASFRRSNFQWLYKKEVPDLDMNFGDFNFKWNYKLNNKNRLFFTTIAGQDLLSNTAANGAGMQWNNFAMTLRWNHIFNAKLFSNTILYTGNYQYKLSAPQDVWHSGIGKLSLKSDFTYFNSANLKTKFGLELHGFAFNPGKILVGDLQTLFPTISQDQSSQTVLYCSTDFMFSDKIRVNLGARLSGWSNIGPAEYYTFNEDYQPVEMISPEKGAYQSYWNISPRGSMQIRMDTSSMLKFSYGIYHQYIQLISNSTSPFTSFEVWLPSSPNIKPQQAHQMAVGLVKYFPRIGLEFSSELYYKKMSNQIDYKPHAHTFLNPYLEGELRFGEMKSYGVEFLLKRDLGRLSGWMGYTYSRVFRNTPDVNNGMEYPAFHDRPHDFSLMLNYQVKPRFLFSAYWTSYSGSTFSSPTGFYTFNHNTIPIYGEKNNDRLPGYKRLDLAFKFILNKNPENSYKHSLTLSLYNVLSHRNIVAVNFNKILDDEKAIVRANAIGVEDLVTTQADLVRFLPSLTYKFTLE